MDTDSPALDPSIGTLLGRVRRRLRLAWAVATGQWIGPAVASLALALVVLGRLRPWRWPELAAIGVAIAAVAVLIVWTISLRITRETAARAADRGLDTKDTFATVLELERAGRRDLLARAVGHRASQAADHAGVRAAIPLVADGRRLLAMAVLAAAALVLGLAANPQDEVRAERETARQILEDEAAALEQSAADLSLADPDNPDQQALVEELLALAEELRAAESLDEGLELLDTAERELRASVSRDVLSQQAATDGLDASLAADPLAGASDGQDAASQLDEAAAALDELSEADQADLADRLEAIADSQQIGSPSTAAALRDAAAALRSGEIADAAHSLTEAGQAQRATAQQARSGAARAATADDIARAASRAQSGSGEGGQDQSNGQGEGQGTGQGEGQGQGQGQGQGNGQGQGEGQGGGQGQGASGAVGGADGSGDDAEGRGGVGRPTGDGRAEANGQRDRSDSLLYDPTFTEGEQLFVDAADTGGDGEIIGQADGPTAQGKARVPLSRALPTYERRATDALRTNDIPPSQRAIVRDYFDRLAER